MPDAELSKPRLPVIRLVLLVLLVLLGLGLFATFAMRTPIVVHPATEAAP